MHANIVQYSTDTAKGVASHHSGRAKQKEHACLIHSMFLFLYYALWLPTSMLYPSHNQEVGIKEKEDEHDVGWVSIYGAVR